MANNDKISKMYNALVKSGYNMASEEVFRQRMSDPNKRKAAYDALKKSGYNMRPYDEFEANIGYGEPAPAPAQASAPPASTQQSPTPTATPTPKATPAPAEASAPAQQARWQPTEQEKIRMSYQLHTMMNDFNQRSRARVEQTRRMIERITPEGRKKLKAAKFQAQLAGTPTSIMGLTPNVSVAPADGQQGANDGAEAPKPLLSGQSPVPYGVVIENGERKTQWLLPDGSLTTDLIEADKAEYGARRVRLMNQFVERMRANGLDPSKQEDVQRQAQLDYEAPIRKAVALAVQADDDRSDAEQDEYMSNPMNMIGGNYAYMGHQAARKSAGIGDLTAIAENAYNSLPAYYRNELIANYTQYFQSHPEDLKGKSIAQAAQDAAKSVVYGQVHETYVGRNAPKGKSEFFIRKMVELNPASVMLSSTITPNGQAYAELDAMDRYGAEHKGLSIAGSVAGMAIDPWVYASGGSSAMARSVFSRAAGRYMAKGMAKGVAERAMMSRPVASRLLYNTAGHMVQGGVNFAIYEAGKDAERQMYQGGYVNPETGQLEGYSMSSILNSGVHGLGMGAVTGPIAPLFGNVGTWLSRKVPYTAGKVGVQTGSMITSKVLEGTIFASPDIYHFQTMDDAEFDKMYARQFGYDTITDEAKRAEARKKARSSLSWDAWYDSEAMMAGFGVSHMIKSVPSFIRSLRPIQPRVDATGREIPLTQEERVHNRMSFEERLRKRMDMSQGAIPVTDSKGRHNGLYRDMRLTKEEREELRNKGYGELSDLFTRSEKPTEAAPEAKPEDGAIDFPRVEAEELGRNPEFDGYEEMERLMKDRNVSQAVRAKVYFILTGRMLPMYTITGYTTEHDADGFTIVNSVGRDGEVITSRRFASDREAQGEIDNINRQAELNTIDVGERYAEEAISLVVMDEVKDIVAGRHRLPAEAVENIYMKHFKGESLSEAEMEIVKDVNSYAEQVSEKYRSLTPEAMREKVNEQFGVDVDDALRKTDRDRTEAENKAVKEYASMLFQEAERQRRANAIFGEQYNEMRAEEKENRRRAWRMQMEGKLLDFDPEVQSEADRIYEESHRAYERLEQGDPTAQADIDAIALRMQEAYQGIEDAFGTEAEYYMSHVNENPWVLLNDPELTAEQKDAVLYYINSKAALDGVMDASNEAGERKRNEVQQAVERRTHKDNGVIIPATMKVDDRQVYLVKGDIVMYPDGSGIDVHNSSESIVVMDAQSGEYEFTSPDRINKVGESIDPQDEIRTAYAQIDSEQEAMFDVYEPSEPEAPQQPIADTKEYDQGYEQGIASTYYSDEELSSAIEASRSYMKEGKLDDFGRGRLEGLEYEQQRRQMEAQNAPAEVAGNNGTENNPQNSNNGVENNPAPEQPAETALSRIPLDEETQEPRFTAVDPETGWDGLVEAMEGEANALPIAQQMIEDANKKLEALNKKPPTPAKPKLAGKAGPMAMRAEQKRVDEANAKAQAEYQQSLAEAQAEAQAWSNILSVYTSRNAELRRQQEEERRQRDAEAHDAAVARFEEEQRITAEKQAEQERVGVHAVNPKIKEKWDNAYKVEGNEDVLTLPDGSAIRGRYVLTEAGAATASHDVNNAYEPTEGFPIDENGQSVNDRDYQGDKEAQRIVEDMSDNYDNRAMQDPVVVSKDGVVLSGNNRTMSGDLAARKGTDKAYNDYLAQFGYKKYGFTAEQVSGMKHPRVVFVPYDDMPYDAATFARFNAREKKAQNKPEAAVKLGKTVPDDVFNVIVSDISRYDRLSDYYSDEKAVAYALGALMQANVINDKDMPDLRTGTSISAGGKELIENTLIGKVFQTSPDAVRQIISMPTLRLSILMGLNEIANNRTLARQGYDLSEELSKAVDLVTRAKAAMPDVYTEGMPVSPFGRMQGLFDDEYGDSRVTDATTLMLADLLNSGKPSELRKVLTIYNKEAMLSSSGQMDLFTGQVTSKEEILRTINEHFRKATPREQQALVEAAIEERKRRAESEAGQRRGSEAVEQTPNADERGGESQQPTVGADNELTPEEQALAARVEVTDNDWAEGEGAKPTYKREIIIDGTHKATQVDAPDESGHYTGSYFEFNGKRFGDIAEIAQYIDGGMKSEPTEAQKAAGNYKMEHRKVDGYNVSIENPKGSVRRGKDADGKEWETEMQNDYGYIRGTQGVDGDHIDVFLSDTPEQGDVFVVDQVNKDGSFDEHKVMYGFPSVEVAREAYLSNYEQGWTGLGAITHVSKDEFKKWIGSSKRKTKPFADYKSVKPIEGNGMIGRSLTDKEATELIERMEATAEIAPTIELTPENWIAHFGEDGTVETPIGIVKMGANQLLKLYSTKRTGYFGMIHPTLNIPDVILEEADPKEGSERDSKYLFVKTFVKSDGSRIVHFESVTVKKDGMEVSISSHEIKDKSLKNKMQNDIVLHLDEKLSPSSELHLTEAPSESEGPDLVPTSDNIVKGEEREDGQLLILPSETSEEAGALSGPTFDSPSDGKVNTLSADKQMDSAESSAPYTITPSSYTNKAGKTTPMHSVKFSTPPTYEQRKALAAFAREKADGKKSRGWCSDKDTYSEWLFRSEEDARKAGEMIADQSGEAVADAQPMTAEEMREAVAPATPTGKPAKTHKPKKAPINRVSLEGVMTDLSEKGETRLSDHAEPVKAEPEVHHEISDEEMQSLAKELRDLLGIGEDEGDAGLKFRDPGELTPQERQRIQSAGIRMAMGLIERGTTSFPDYATKMVGLLGDKIRPWLKSFYEGARWTPGYENIAFTPSEEVARFDVQNFDKAQADPIAQASMIVEERKASTASAQAQKELIETRNKNRRENDKQRESDTAALTEKAEAVASEAESLAETSADAGELNRAGEAIDQAVEEINDQLALLGYYEAVEDEAKFHESYGYMLTAEKKAVADATALAKQLVKDLGIDLKVTSATTPLGRKSVKKGTAVRANLAPAGGDVMINLPLNEGRELAIYIGLEPVAEKGSRRRGDNLAVERIMYRVENPNGKGYDRYGNNNWANNDVTYAEFLRRVKYASRGFLPEEKAVTSDSEPTEESYHGTITLKDGREAFVIVANHVQNIGEPSRVTDYIVGVKGEPGTTKISPDEIAHAGAPTAEDKPTITTAKAKAEESHNGYKVGDEVMWDRYGNGKWEKQVIKDFDENGRPILDSFGTNWISEIGDWERIKPADGIFGEARRVARATQEKKQTPATPKADDATQAVVDILRGGKAPTAKKKPAVKPEQPVADLFGGLFDEPISDEKKTDVRPRSGSSERERGHEPRQNEPLGESQRNEVKPTDGRGMVGRSGNNTKSDTTGGSRVSEPSDGKRNVKPAKPEPAPLAESERKNTHNNHAERGTDYAPKGTSARIEANIKAIETMQRLIERGEPATPEDMSVLRKFSGWGGLGAAFKEKLSSGDSGYNPRLRDDYQPSNPINARLRELLSPEAYEAAQLSRNTAFYTPAPIIDAMWDVARAMGFRGGSVLEGSAGIGKVLGLMPTDMSERSNIQAIEVDETTGNILKLLYPDAKVDVKGFEKTYIPNGSVDLAITNVPFGDILVKDETGDKDLSKKFRAIHDFCIAKNVRKLKEGGIGIFISTSGTLDSANSAKLRNWIVNEGNADVVGAFRMHKDTFGGAGVTSDIIIIRKRVNGRKSANAIDVSGTLPIRTVKYSTGETKRGSREVVIKDLALDVNKHFVEHPEDMAGEMAFAFEKGDNYRATSKALYPSPSINQEQRLSEWAQQFKDMDWDKAEERESQQVTYEDLGEDVKEGSMLLDSDGNLCLAQRGKAVPINVNANKVKGHTKAECFNAYKAIKDALADVLEYQTTHSDDSGLQQLLAKLNKSYDSFVKTYGHLNKNTSITFLRSDMDYPSIAALESVSETGDKSGKRIVTYGKTDIFSRRVVETESEPKPTTIKDGIIASIYLNGRVDVPYIADQLNKSDSEVRQQIIESGLGFENPTTTEMEVSYEYLSGNVREKLRQAQENNREGRYDANIKALERVIPMNIPAHLIEFTLGSSWVDPKLYEEFVKERTGLRVKLTNAGGTWIMREPYYTNTEQNKAMGVISEKCDKTILGHELIKAAITCKSISVTKTISTGYGSSKTTETIVDKDATMACANKIDEIRQDFKDWARGKMQGDPEMSERMERVYNDLFNNSVPKEIPDDFVPEHFGGSATIVNGKPFKLRPHQAKAVIRATTQPLMLAHEVGTGKTYTLITTAMEMRRLGTARKPMIVVQNATVGQFVASAKALYPNAKILTLEDSDRNAEGRRNFYAKIRYNDWDMIVVPQSVFERIPDSEERQIRFIEDKVEEKMMVLEKMREAANDDRDPVLRQAQRELDQLNDELNDLKLALQERKTGGKTEKDEKREAKTRQNAMVKAQEMLDRETDDVANFDDMGIDALLIDEAHEYKHLGFATAMQRGVKGVDPSYSKKSQGVYLKTQAVLENKNGKNVVFATGTPISNTAAEIWTFMRYLMPADTMREYGIYYFDDFVRNFGNIQQMLEFSTNGKYKENNRFAGYVNLPELVRIWAGVADTVLTREAGGVSDKIPKMDGEKAQDIYLPQTKALRGVMKFVKDQLDDYEKMSGKEKKENSHIPLVMYGIAKAAAVDARLVLKDAADEPNSKTNEAVRQTLRSLEDTKEYNGTVAIFADNYQNKATGFNLYEDIRKKLIDAGVPETQVVVMKSGMSIKKKLEIFDKVNRGEVRVIMGSTFTLGTGVNIQERLHTLIHVDAPNRPMDYTQRNGRILRQGNLHNEWGIPVRVLRFGVEDSLDVTAYQRLKTKGAIADSIMEGKKMMSNSMENRVLEEEQDLFGDITAQLSGSQYALLKNQVEKEVKKLEARKKQWEADQTYVHNQKPRLKALIKDSEERAKRNKEALAKVEAAKNDGISIGKMKFPSLDAMGDYIKDYNSKQREQQEQVRTASDYKAEAKSDLTVSVGGFDFHIHRDISKEQKQEKGQLSLSFFSKTQMTYSCPELGLEDVPVDGQRLKSALEDILENVLSGDYVRERAEYADRAAERYKGELQQVEARDGKPFEYADELKQAKERLAEYEELMKSEMAEKEAKYAEMDKAVEAATDVSFSEEESEEAPTSGDGNKYRLVEDKEMVDFLEGQPLKLGYRYSQWANMGVLPPMTAKQNGEWRAPMIFSRWEQSEEGMRKENGKADLVQGNGRTTGDVAYNPYFHIRTSPLNDQFTAAYDRPELLVVEGYYPESEESSGYRAEGAKDSVGLMDWHSGSVNGQLSDETKVQTMLSRYFKPSRIVPWSEVADLIMERVGDQRITFPINAVPPMLRAELAKRGAKFGEISGTVADADIAMLNDLRDRVNAGEWDAGLEKAREYMDAYESSPEAKEARVEKLSSDLHTPIRVISDQSEIDKLPTRRERRAKGWWSSEDNGVVVVLPNNVNVSDVDNTVVHEVVGHKGLRALIGAERFDEFLGEVYSHASNPIRKRIDKMTDDMVKAEADRLRVRKSSAHERAGEDVNRHYYTDMAEARTEAEQKREQFRKEATEEYMSDLGGRIGSEGFAQMSRDELTLWGKIKAKVQQFLDKFLRGLKIAKSIRLNDKDLSYILYKSWKNLRKKGVFAEAEDAVRRRESGYDADDATRFRDPGMGLEETITRIKAEAMQANAGNLQAKREAMRAIGGNLNHLRQAMARQREYDITTVKSVTDLARVLMEAGLLDDLSKYETKRILGAINNVVGKQDVSQYVQKVMDIMVDNQLRNGAGAFGKLLAIRGSRVDARGIEVQGELDPDGQRIAQVVKKSTSLPKDDIDNRIAEAINRMSSTDQAIADEATLEYAGLQLARQYVEEITESKAEEKGMRDSIKQAKEDKEAGQMDEEAYKQYVESTNDAIRQNKIERAEAYQSLIEQMGDALSASVERAKAWREAEKQRVEEIHHNANSDMEGRPTEEHHKEDRVQKIVNNSGVRFLLAPLATFDQMLRMFGNKNVRGEGYLWNRYMRGWVSATEKEYTGYRDALKVLDAKVSEVYGKDMKWGDLFTIDRKLPKATVRFWDGGEMKDHELTQGNLLYIYMADKMSDGRMKLRRMGITEDDIEDIKNFLDPRFIELADWMQEEFLVDKRNEYNEVHKRMFGASMAAIENYFPLKILANARLENVDVADDTTDNVLPATSTGSIIKRRRNNLALDVTGANAFTVILDHLQQMERWAAFAEFNRDLNTLLSYKRFRNQVMNMSSVYGAGKTLWNNFRNVCAMAAGAYRPPIAALDKWAVNIAKGVTAAKVSYRIITALKQFLSMPAYLSDSNPAYLVANIANPIGAWKWSMENLPLFEKRWKSRMAGDPRLLKTDMDWKMWRSRVVEIASRVGMSPNAFVDALTVAIGTHAMYQTKLAKYKRQGYDPEVAEERAKQDATILFNQTQQSSEGAFLSTMQVDRSWLSVLFTVFRNSSMSYTRQLYDSIRNLGRRITPGYKGMSEEFMAKQMRRDGIDPDQADRNAKREYRRGIIRDIVRVGVFGYILQLAWNLGAYLPYLILGDDEEEKDKMMDDVFTHSKFGSIEGLTGGDVMSAAGNMWLTGEGNPAYLTKDMPLASDVLTILKKMDKDQVSAMNDVINLCVQSGIGVNPQSLTDAVTAVIDYCGDDAETSRECALLMARVFNCPQSQIDKIYFDELDASARAASKMTPSEIAERYARYKVRRGAPLTGWAYGSEQREKLMEKYRDRSNTLAKERLSRETDNVVSPNMATMLKEFNQTEERVSEINKVKSKDEDKYYEMLDELEATPEYDRYLIIKDYKREVDALTKEWLRATTPAARDSCAQAIITLKREMVSQLQQAQ